jgi:transcriptional regulator with XRE-family HTH domain
MKNEDDMLKAIIDVIRSEREAQGFNYEDFSAVSGLHRTTLGLYDRGERGPTVEAALSMAQALGVPLSELIRKAEDIVSKNSVCETFKNRREVPLDNFRNSDRLRAITGLSFETIRAAILDCYQTLDTIDAQLLAHGSAPIANLVELANLSSIIGNLVGAGLATASNGLYIRNRPHAYPDLVPQATGFGDLEIKVALEKNKPKGHLPKAGNYLTFRYVLCDDLALYEKGKENRGKRVFIWEVKVGTLTERDFDTSNTEGDSGKTAVINTDVFNAMPLIYFDSDLLPYSKKSLRYPGFN